MSKTAVLGLFMAFSVHAGALNSPEMCQYFLSKGAARDQKWSSYPGYSGYQAEAELLEPLFGAKHVRVKRQYLEDDSSSLSVLNEAGETLKTYVQKPPKGQAKFPEYMADFSFGRVTAGGFLIEEL